MHGHHRHPYKHVCALHLRLNQPCAACEQNHHLVSRAVQPSFLHLQVVSCFCLVQFMYTEAKNDSVLVFVWDFSFFLLRSFSQLCLKKCFLCFCYFTILKFGKTISKRLNKRIGMLSFSAVCIYTRWRSLNFEASSSKQQEDNHMTWLARVYVPSCRCLTSGLWEWCNPAYPAWAMGTRGTSTCLCFLYQEYIVQTR